MISRSSHKAGEILKDFTTPRRICRCCELEKEWLDRRLTSKKNNPLTDIPPLAPHAPNVIHARQSCGQTSNPRIFPGGDLALLAELFLRQDNSDMPPKKKGGAAAGGDEGGKMMLLGRPGNNVKMGIVGLPNVGKSSLFNCLAGLVRASIRCGICSSGSHALVLKIAACASGELPILHNRPQCCQSSSSCTLQFFATP